MPLYRCPVTGQSGFLSIGRQSFDDWACMYFGEYHTWDDKDVLPLPCRSVWNLARKPKTHAEFVAWMKKKYPGIKVIESPPIGTYRKSIRVIKKVAKRVAKKDVKGGKNTRSRTRV